MEISTEGQPFEDHPLAGLTVEEREQARSVAVATVLASIVHRKVNKEKVLPRDQRAGDEQ